jgi:IS5 family transposase
MLRGNPEQTEQEDLFRARLALIVDMTHELVRLAGLVDWSGLAKDLAGFYCTDNGRPGGSIRLMAGLCFLKDLKGLSDEEVCAAWRENPYFQYFCGEEFFQHRLPVEPPSLSIFRKRIGGKGVERLLAVTVKLGLKTGAVKKNEIENVNVDTTVQEKAIRFPTDTQLCHKAREELVKAAARHEVRLRQTYVRKSKQAVLLANRYMAARQVKRGRRMIETIRNYLGRVMRDIERACEKTPHLHDAFKTELTKARTIFAQALNPKAPDKIYSWHAPETECIAKGKVHKKYEFGCKASIASTNKSNFIVGAMAHHGKPYDGHTPRTVLEQVKQLTGVKPRWRRAAIEPIIGHCKNDRKVGPRNWLAGKQGDSINAIAIAIAIAMAIGFNLRKILRKIFLWLLARWLRRPSLIRPTLLQPAGWVF